MEWMIVNDRLPPTEHGLGANRCSGWEPIIDLTGTGSNVYYREIQVSVTEKYWAVEQRNTGRRNREIQGVIEVAGNPARL